MFNKESNNISWGKNSLFNEWWWENWIVTCEGIKLNPYLVPSAKINSKWIKDLNIRPGTVKLLKENLDIGLGNDFFDWTPKAKLTRAKISKWNYIKLNSFYTERK